MSPQPQESQAQAALLQFNELCLCYPDSDSDVISKLSGEIHEGEILVLYGPSGIGKSTLLHSFAGLHTPSSGKVSLFGKNLYQEGKSTRFLSSQKTSLCLQQTSLENSKTVLQNILTPCYFGPGTLKEGRKLALELAQKLDLNDLLHSLVKNISGGQQQRVAIARSLINRPKLLLIDEPFAAQDQQRIQAISDLFRSPLWGEPLTLVTTAHEKDTMVTLSPEKEIFLSRQSA